jgi:hypothetical protein
VAAEDYGSLLWQLTQRLTVFRVEFEDSPMLKMRTVLLCNHDTGGGHRFDGTLREMGSNRAPYRVRYVWRQDLAEMRSIHEKQDSPFTHPKLYEAAEETMAELRRDFQDADEFRAQQVHDLRMLHLSVKAFLFAK